MRYLLLCLCLATPAQAATIDDHPKVERCADHHPWTQVQERAPLLWCIAHTYDPPGSPRYAISVARCESGTDLQDTYAGDGFVGTYQHITDQWYGRWRVWGKGIGVKSSPTNVLSQAVVSIRMALAVGWGPWACA